MTAECRNSAVNFFACAEMLCQNFHHGGVPPVAVFTLLKSARAAAALRCRLTATRLIRGGTRQGDALFPRASPLQKSPTGAFLNSPLAEGLLTLEVSRSAERDRGAAPGPCRL